MKGQLLKLTAGAFALCVALVLASQAAAATITVNTYADELNSEGDCSLREAIQAANTNGGVDRCVAGGGADTVVLPAGIYTLTINGAGEHANLTGDLDILSPLIISGAGPSNTVIAASASFSDRIIDIPAAVDVTISGVTIQYGRPQDEVRGSGSFLPIGGGVLNETGRLTVTNTVVRENVAYAGGGVYVRQGLLALGAAEIYANRATFGAGVLIYASKGNIHSSELFNNSGITNTLASGCPDDYSRLLGVSWSGGGAILVSGSELAIANSRIHSNFAPCGGGILNDHFPSSTTLDNSAVYSNTANEGGGVQNADALTMTNSAVYSNTAHYGGGGVCNGCGLYSSRLVVSASAIYGNVGALGGGGLANAGFGRATLTNGTISANQANGGGGIQASGGNVELINTTLNLNVAPIGSSVQAITATYCIKCGGVPSVITGVIELQNTIVANGVSSGDCATAGGEILSHGHNLGSDASCDAYFSTSGDITNTNPLLGPLTLFSPAIAPMHALLAGSLAIDAADDEACPVTDQRGISRPQGTHCDIGAYEVFVPRAFLHLPLIWK